MAAARRTVHARGMLRPATCALLLCLALLGACGAEEPSHRAIGRDAWAVRAAFNADAGRVRVIVLVAPT